MTARLSPAAVMARRNIPRGGADYFATPPWATRALVYELTHRRQLPRPLRWGDIVAEPACGGGHMAGVLRASGLDLAASDKHDYGWGHPTCDFLTSQFRPKEPIDWVITNPPFNRGDDFAIAAMRHARVGAALLCRTGFTEGARRYDRLFGQTGITAALRPAYIIQFASRVTMHAGGWFPYQRRRGATSYAWFVWLHGNTAPTVFDWFAPSTETQFTRPDDVELFAGEVAPCVLGAGG